MAFQISVHLVFWPSVSMPQKCPYWDIFGLPYCRLHQSQIPNVLATRSGSILFCSACLACQPPFHLDSCQEMSDCACRIVPLFISDCEILSRLAKVPGWRFGKQKLSDQMYVMSCEVHRQSLNEQVPK